MKKILFLFLLIFPQTIFAATPTLNIKYGEIKTNETWAEKIYIIGDVTIPKGVTVTVQENAELIFADYDLLQSGNDQTQCELLVQGCLDTVASANTPIKFSSLRDKQPSLLKITPETQVIQFKPYQIETDKMREEFRSFKQQYLIMWSIIYAMWIMR